MVCLGNICRSPLAEGILKSKVNAKMVQVDSAGTAGYHIGNLPDTRSIEVARNHGIDITDQRSRKFEVRDFDNLDEILVMDANNFQDVLSLARDNNDCQKVKMILNEIDPNTDSSVPDPYYGGEEGFESVFQMLDKACELLKARLS